MPSEEFRVLLLRRLRLALPLTPKRCRCGGRLDSLGDHRSSCAQVGVLAQRAGPLERAVAHICREVGARVATNVALRELNLDSPATDGRRIEVVANGLPLWRGAQIAIDTTLVSPVQRNGLPHAGAQARPALALQQAKARKFRTYPELQPGGQARCRLVVFGLEVGGRFDRQAVALLRRLARARARDRVPWARAAAIAALTRRWTALAVLAALRAHAQSLLELPIRPCDASDGAELPLGELLAVAIWPSGKVQLQVSKACLTAAKTVESIFLKHFAGRWVSKSEWEATNASNPRVVSYGVLGEVAKQHQGMLFH